MVDGSCETMLCHHYLVALFPHQCFRALKRHAGNGSIAGELPERLEARRAPFFRLIPMTRVQVGYKINFFFFFWLKDEVETILRRCEGKRRRRKTGG
jgi:hypothetical protein